MSEPTRVAVVAGVLGGKPGNSGHAWTRISLAVGLQRLGFDVVYVEQLPNAGPVQRAHFHRVCSEFSIPGFLLAGQVPYELISRLEDADLLLNIGGHLTIPELKGAPRVKVYLDDDPGYTQLWHLSDLLSGRLEGHDFHFTFGLNIGHPACSVPLNGIHWRPMHPPVVLDQWPRASTQGDGFRTVASWRGDYGRVEAGGQLYGQKAHEFRRFIHLPQYVDVAFEIALEFDSADANDVEQMRAHGWNIVHPSTVVGSPGAFRAYVQESAAEFSVARGIYVETNCGWFGRIADGLVIAPPDFWRLGSQLSFRTQALHEICRPARVSSPSPLWKALWRVRMRYNEITRHTPLARARSQKSSSTLTRSSATCLMRSDFESHAPDYRRRYDN